MSERPHAMTDYLIAIGLHLNSIFSLEDVASYFTKVSPQNSGHASWHCTSLLFDGLRSGKLEPWEPVFKRKQALVERWEEFWKERGTPAPYHAGLFFMRFQKHSPLVMDPVDRLIFLKIRNGGIENLEELVEHLLRVEGPRTPDGVFAINTMDLARALRRRRITKPG